MSDYNKNDIGSGYNTTTAINTELDKIETAVNSKMDSDGDTMTGQLDMNSQKILNVAEGTAASDAVNLGQVSDLSIAAATGLFIDTVTVATMVLLEDLEVGASVVQTAEFSTGNGGGGTYDVVSVGTTAGVDLPDTYSIIVSVEDPTICFVLRRDQTITPEHLGVFGDSSTEVSTGLQAYADYCIANKLEFTLTGGKTGTAGEFKISSSIDFSDPCNITSIGDNKGKLLCVDCDGINYTGSSTTPSQITIKKILIAQSIRHTTTPNTYRGITFAGSTSSRPFWNLIEDVFIDGFGIPLDWSWVWSTKVVNCNTVFCGEFINAVGICANNKIYKNDISGNLVAFDIGDGTNTCEGWHIDHNLIDGINIGFAIDGVGCSYFKFTNNILDFMGAGTAVLMRSAASLPSIGHDIKTNYIAFNAAGSEGIRMLNNLAPATTNQGSTISDNIIFPYATHSLSQGILLDGTSESNNTIRGNKIEASVADINNSAAVDSTITENKMFGAGFSTTTNCIYTDNEGTLITSQIFLERTFGPTTESYSVAIPTTGTYTIGDCVYKTAPTLDGNNMTLIGWKRLTTGAGHVPGTDWALLYISHISPAT